LIVEGQLPGPLLIARLVIRLYSLRRFVYVNGPDTPVGVATEDSVSLASLARRARADRRTLTHRTRDVIDVSGAIPLEPPVSERLKTWELISLRDAPHSRRGLLAEAQLHELPSDRGSD
jgi:hypothetical protein